MTILQNSLPAERMCGCSFAPSFRSAFDVVRACGTIYGTPSFGRNGVTLNGTNDYVSYNVNLEDNSNISIIIEFYPDFDTDADSTVYFFASNSANDTIFKRDNAGSNILRLNLGGTNIADITEATYSPYWNVGTRNVLVISGTSGNTSVWLNGNAILTNDATAWTPSGNANLGLGGTISGSGLFDGKIGAFKMFNSLLTAQDALNFYNSTTFDYTKNCLINLPLTSETYDPTNNRILDISGNGNHATLGDGSTSSTFPTKLAKRGAYFDNANDYFGDLPALTGDFTVAILADNEVSFYNTDTVYETIKTSGSFGGNLQQLIVIDDLLTSMQEEDCSIRMLQSINKV